MQVVWKGDDTNAPACRAFDTVFVAGEPKDISHLDPAFQKKLMNNICFSVVEGVEEKKEAKPAPEVDERDALIARGDELGLDLNKRMSADTMRERIAEAEAK